MNIDLRKSKTKFALIAVVVAILIVVVGIATGRLYYKNTVLNRELVEKQQELKAWQDDNDALAALVEEENETALMEEYARKSGYVYPDERVYIDGN